MKLTLDHQCGVPLSVQLEKAILGNIDRRRFPAGGRLPSIRQLSAELGISRNTAVEAYSRLVSQGAVRSQAGSGYFVEEFHTRQPATGMVNPDDASNVSDELWHLFGDRRDSVKLGCGWVPDAWRESAELAYAIRQTVRLDRGGLFDYGTPLGMLGLRDNLSRRLLSLNIDAPSHQIVLTNGASHALDLIVRLLLRPGDTVFVETPGYYNLFGLLKLQGIRMIGVPRSSDGPDLDAMERLLASNRPKLFFINSIFHNPTGTSLSVSVAYRVLQLAEKYDFQIVEDDIYADFEITPSARLASLDQLQRVIYVGSFSKTLTCSLRVGFIAAPKRLIKQLVDVKMLTSITSSRFAEEVLTSMLDSGAYRKLVERLRRRLGERIGQTCQLMADSGWVLFCRPTGGMFVWARWPGVADAAILVEHAAKKGVSLGSGAVFTPEMTISPWVRINVTYGDDPRADAFLRLPT